MCLDNRLTIQYRKMLGYVDVYVSLDRFIAHTFWFLTMRETNLYSAVCLRRARVFTRKRTSLGALTYLTRSSPVTLDDRGKAKS